MSRRGVAPHVLFHAEGFRGGPVADADGRAYQRLPARPQQLAQRLHTVKQSLAAVGGDDEVFIVREQDVAFFAHLLIGGQSVARQKFSHPFVVEAGQDDRPLLRLGFGLHADDFELQAGAVGDLFGERFRGDAVFRLMAELDVDFSFGADVERAFVQMEFFRRGLKLKGAAAVVDDRHRRRRGTRQ